MTQVTLNGNAYSDDGTTSRDLQGGGHREWLVKMLSDSVADLAAKRSDAATQATNAAQSATNASGSASAAFSSAVSSSNSATTATTQANNASDSATLASQWATQSNDKVAAVDYSAKEWAVGVFTRGSAGGGSAKDWATYTGGTVDGTLYSAKYWAQVAQAAAGSTGLPVLTGASDANKKVVANASGNAYIVVSDPTLGYSTVSDPGSITLAPAAIDGQFTVVDGMGLYRYDSSSTEAADGETVIGVSSGSGRWLQVIPHWDFSWASLAPIFDDLQQQLLTVSASITSVVTPLGEYLGIVQAISATSVDIDFPETHSHFIIVGENITNVSGTTPVFQVRYKIDGASDSQTSYAYNSARIQGTSAPSAIASSGDTQFNLTTALSASGSDYDGNLQFEMINPRKKTFRKQCTWRFKWNNSIELTFGGGEYNGTNGTNGMITGVRLFWNNGNISGNFRLYGVRRP